MPARIILDTFYSPAPAGYWCNVKSGSLSLCAAARSVGYPGLDIGQHLQYCALVDGVLTIGLLPNVKRTKQVPSKR